ncbi:TnsD family Tn7-like transposition protein [Thermomonas sp. HDW16]|uniref:TnsD family Tn7-like transposition protein n=1 Tax=Thermomonas sp. HDW16 TaxID=2714945 RepID=UPI00140A85CB|nr:TnsD family Tn7-like transposition protein [Thermomonas sp. HDW16]QIL19765.1 hypothetical protein G7079_02930 [Thermomonas sp. HDW16]
MTTLAYFPEIYPKELLYSVLARYHRHTGTPSSSHTMEALFGRRLIVASLDLPGHIQALADRLPTTAGWTADRIVDELTLLPYYTAYQSAAVRRLARRSVIRGASNCLMTRLGMAAFGVQHITKLRFCRLCQQDMLSMYGECYWRRDHQLPGALVCADHGCSLQVSTVSLVERGRHEFVAADRRVFSSDAPMMVRNLDQQVMSDLQRLAQISRNALENPGPAKSCRAWTQYYRLNIGRLGCSYSMQRVDQRRLREQFNFHHKTVLPELSRLFLGRGESQGWLAAIVRKHRKAFHPLHHLLVQDFLDHQEVRTDPFGNGPWPCLSPLAEHKGRPTVARVEVHRNRGHQVGVFQCACGYTYTRSHFGGDRGLGPPRFQTYGPSLVPALRGLVREGYSLRAVARRLEIDPKTVVKLVEELGIDTVWKARAVPKRELKIRPPVVSAPPKGSGKAKAVALAVRVDWSSRDEQVSAKISRAAREIRGLVPLVRVTTLQIERRCWNRGWLSKRAEKLPKAMRRLKGVVETVNVFRRRRIAWAIDEMAKADARLVAWQVLRKAGLGTEYAELAKGLVDEYLGVTQRRAA